MNIFFAINRFKFTFRLFLIKFKYSFKLRVPEKLAISGKFTIPSVIAYCGTEILVGNIALTADTDISNVLYGFF